MNFEEFMTDKKVYVSDQFMSDTEGLKLLLSKQSEFDIVKYPFIKKILIFNIPVMEKDNDGNYYYDCEIKRDCDIISDFTINSNDLNIRFSFICGINEYEINDLKYILLAACVYSAIKLRITFNDDKMPRTEKTEVIFTYYKYICNRNISYYLMKNKMITPTIIYNEGLCLKNGNN